MAISEHQAKILKMNNKESNKITKESIQDALFILLKKEQFEKITISEIINKSGVSRSAFYRNFKTKEDILDDNVNEVVSSVISSFKASNFKNWELIFIAAKNNQEKIELLIKAKLEHKILDRINAYLDSSSFADGLAYRMWFGIIYNTIIGWANDGMKETTKTITKLFIETLTATMNKVI